MYHVNVNDGEFRFIFHDISARNRALNSATVKVKKNGSKKRGKIGQEETESESRSKANLLIVPFQTIRACPVR